MIVPPAAQLQQQQHSSASLRDVPTTHFKTPASAYLTASSFAPGVRIESKATSWTSGARKRRLDSLARLFDNSRVWAHCDTRVGSHEFPVSGTRCCGQPHLIAAGLWTLRSVVEFGLLWRRQSKSKYCALILLLRHMELATCGRRALALTELLNCLRLMLPRTKRRLTIKIIKRIVVSTEIDESTQHYLFKSGGSSFGVRRIFGFMSQHLYIFLPESGVAFQR